MDLQWMTVLGAAIENPKSYLWLKWGHVLGMIIYVGGFLALTRLLGHAVRFESAQSRKDAYRIFRRMHKFVDWGGLGIMLVTGAILLVSDPLGKNYMKQGYLHMKLTMVLILVICDVVLTKRLFALTGDETTANATPFRILHGVSALALVGALIAVFVVRG